MSKPTLGVIVGNRDFFPDQLVSEARRDLLQVLGESGVDAVMLDESQSKLGSVETWTHAQRCAELFRAHRDRITGVLVCLPNFGDEKGVADALNLAELNVPVLVQGYPDDLNQLGVERRRDAFCGKISVCNNLWQYGIPYTLTGQHTVKPASDSFKADLKAFAATCRVVKGMRNVRVGVLGARPAAFNTVRFSEKLMEHAGITVETLDLSEVFGRVSRLKDDDPKAKAKLDGIQGYVETRGIPPASLLKMAKFGLIVDEWMKANELVGSSVQCWTAMEEFFGVVPCTLMSMMSNNLVPSACETDMIGMIGMYILQLASGTPSAIVDWNNNYGDDPDKCVIFHCSNLPKHFFEDFKMDFQEIIAGSVGKDSTYGTVVGKLKSGPITFCRASTDDLHGRMRAYVGEGETTDDRPQSFGGYGVMKVSRLQKLLQYVCKNGYEHHVAVNRSHYGNAVAEALGNYKKWEVYRHQD